VNRDRIEQAELSKPEYRAIATPLPDGGYQIDFVNLGSTQTRETSRDAVERLARDFLAMLLDLPVDAFRVTVEFRDG
jgi:hypothetical protein